MSWKCRIGGKAKLGDVGEVETEEVGEEVEEYGQLETAFTRGQ